MEDLVLRNNASSAFWRYLGLKQKKMSSQRIWKRPDVVFGRETPQICILILFYYCMFKLINFIIISVFVTNVYFHWVIRIYSIDILVILCIMDIQCWISPRPSVDNNCDILNYTTVSSYQAIWLDSALGLQPRTYYCITPVTIFSPTPLPLVWYCLNEKFIL